MVLNFYKPVNPDNLKKFVKYKLNKLLKVLMFIWIKKFIIFFKILFFHFSLFLFKSENFVIIS
jgi:hypothetical protein